jgi:hypothetical protein
MSSSPASGASPPGRPPTRPTGSACTKRPSSSSPVRARRARRWPRCWVGAGSSCRCVHRPYGQRRRRSPDRRPVRRRDLSYRLVVDSETYDSKAVVGAARGFLPGEEPLAATDFSGRAATVRRLLTAAADGGAHRASLEKPAARRQRNRHRQWTSRQMMPADARSAV